MTLSSLADHLALGVRAPGSLSDLRRELSEVGGLTVVLNGLTAHLCRTHRTPLTAVSIAPPIRAERPYTQHRKHITAIWQSTWDESPLNKLHEIAPIVNEPRTHHLSTRRDQSVFNRCRIGHSRLTQLKPPPECISRTY